ncbi:MAG: helix-turn-helix transcriptional regulator [Actinobacteria bacterium]|nr:helix-turn-helix transcriptional regulator [Actinomycetota bacterium]MCA1739825.1 helix-turn-helix transcriptional regulator [Actinomycetota bacterium]
MDGSRSAERVRQEIIRLSHAGLDSRTFRVEAVKQLRKAIPVDVSFFATADPATLLFTSAVVDDVLARATGEFLENEFLKDDSVKFTSLARAASPVDSLGVATGGELVRSPRYEEILEPMDLGDELRAALKVGSKCWGFMCLHREGSSPHFSSAEAALLARLAPHLAEGLRNTLLVGDSQGTSPSSNGPGLLLLADDLSLVAITPAAEAWLTEVAESDWRSALELPEAVYAVAARLLALERSGHTPPDPMPRIRLRTASGRWLVLHASRLRAAESEERIAVIFEEARPAEIAPLIVDAYGLTKREGEITQLVLRGLSTAEVSRQLHITPNTVRDHFKSIFDKVGVRSRRELVGQVFAQHYQPRMATGQELDADGWFT